MTDIGKDESLQDDNSGPSNREEWDASLKAGLADLKAGRVRRFDSDEAFMKHLKELEGK